MKKHLLLFVFGILAFTASAQMSVPNGNFESWTSGTYEFPQYYGQNSNPQTFFECMTPFNVTKTTDYYSGSFALQLTTNVSTGDTCFGYIADANNTSTSGGPSSWTGGMPIAEKPLGITGHYKYNVASADSALIIVIARQGGASIGFYSYTLGGIHGTYVPFNFTFSPVLAVIPDSIIVAFASSNPLVNQGIPGSTLIVDSISFTGITTQPAQMNGDFEMWQTQTLEKPNFWILQSGGGSGTTGVTKTTDKVAGTFAIEMQTFLGDNNGTPAARGASVGTGYWDNSCSCQKGGYPFSNQIDTLAFYYKYIPIAGDSASVNLSFKSGGSMILNQWATIHSSLSYQYMEIPFNTMSTPDSVIINIQSSVYQDSSIVFVGSDLKIDEMHFKTQPLTTGINQWNLNNQVNFYPNPFRTTGTILISPEINTQGMSVTIYDVTGRVIRKVETNEHKITIDRTSMVNGIYFYELKTNNNVIKTGKIIIE